MLSRKYLPSFGFFILAFSIMSSILFINWIVGPLDYEKKLAKREMFIEKAAYYENKGHKYYKEGKYKQAFVAFITAADVETSDKSRGVRYRHAGGALGAMGDTSGAAKYYKKAFNCNPRDEKAIDFYMQMRGTYE